MKKNLLRLAGALLLILSGCGGPSLQSGQSVSVDISPTQLSLRTFDSTSSIYGTETLSSISGTTVSVTAAMSSDLFDWAIDEGSAGGTLSPSTFSDTYYTYTAPGSAGTYHVTITDKKDRTKTARLTIVVTN